MGSENPNVVTPGGGSHHMPKKSSEEWLQRDTERLVTLMRRVEKAWGHHGVFNAIRVWLNKPLRGNFGTKR